jgi:hypothetical protein
MLDADATTNPAVCGFAHGTVFPFEPMWYRTPFWSNGCAKLQTFLVSLGFRFWASIP